MNPRAGVVLAAGFGSRLREQNAIKPLTDVGGRALLVRAVEHVLAAGAEEAIIVLGYEAAAIRDAFQSAYDGDSAKVRFVTNEHYALSNGVSVLAAREAVAGRAFVLTMADHVFDDTTLRVARDHTPEAGGASLLVDRKLEDVFDMDDATKVWVDEGKIAQIGKQLTRFNAVDTGLFVCTPALFEGIAEAYAARGDASLSDGVQRLCDAGRMAAVDIGPGWWQDVDTPEMLAEARRRLGAHAQSG